MKRSIISLIVLLYSIPTFCQTHAIITDTNRVSWKNSSALVLAPGRIEIGILAPLAIGLKNNMEISIQKLLFFVAPNLKLKKNWSNNANNPYQFVTDHSILYPTAFMNMLATDWIIGIYPPNETIPPIIAFENRFIGSYFFTDNLAVSFKAGIQINLLYDKNPQFQEVELLYIYPRTASYTNPFVAEFAIGLVGNINKTWTYNGDLTLFYVPSDENVFVFELNPKLYYQCSDKFRVAFGANFTAGNVPHEKQDFRILPFIDFQWAPCHNSKKGK